MKKKTTLLTSALVLGTLLVAGAANAASGAVKGNVDQVLFKANGQSGYLYLTITGTSTNTGTCKQPPAAVKMFAIPANEDGDRERQILMSALLAGKSVTIYWNDASTYKDASGYCLPQSVLISQTP